MTQFLHRSATRVASIVLLGVSLSACGTTNVNYVTGESQRGAYTWAQERQIGTEADQQIVAQYGVYDSPTVNAYVSNLAQEVLSASAYGQSTTPAEIRNTPFTFRVLDSPVVNAFALPGGFVYVTRGLLAHVENEAQLAVVLGHEIGHVLARHSSRQAQRAQLGQLGVVGAAVLGGVVGGGRVAEGIAQYGGQGAQLLLLSYGRDAEREADQAGVAYAEFADYDAAQSADFFRSLKRLGDQSGQAIPTFLSTHPDPGAREQTVRQLAAAASPKGTEVNEAEYMRAINGLILGVDPKQGFTEGNSFYHPELRFTFSYPRGWRLANSPQAVQIVDPNGAAAVQITLVQQTSAQAAAQGFASQQGIQTSGARTTTINGNRAATVEGTAPQQQGTTAFIATFIEFGGNVYQILGITSQSAAQVRNELTQPAQTFERLTDSRYLNRQPVRLDVTTVDRPTSLQSLLSGRTLPQDLTAQDIAIMNQIELTETLPRGTTIKLPGS